MDELMLRGITAMCPQGPPPKEESGGVWAGIANACNDRARKLFNELDEHPEYFEQMAGLVRLVMDIENHIREQSETT